MPFSGDVTRRRLLLSGIAAAAEGLLPSISGEQSQPNPSVSNIWSRELNAADFGARSGDGSDTTPVVRRILEKCTIATTQRILFPTGVYDFWPDRAVEKYIYASNNDPGLKRVAFLIAGISELELDGQGSTFIFHGEISPFILDKSRDIRINNLTIDWRRPFHNEGRIVAANDAGIDLEIQDQFPYRIQNGLLYFLDENHQGRGIRGRDPFPLGSILEFNSEKHETEYMVRDYYRIPSVTASEIKPGVVRISEPALAVKPGNILVFGATNRNHPAFTISDCDSIRIEGVTIHHCGGMGIIAQRSGDIHLNRIRVTPSRDRMVSLPADATHFVNCRGQIELTDCLFENQLDDATNIHGVYGQVTRRLSGDEIEVRLVHPAQRGFDLVIPNEKLEMVHSTSLETYSGAVAQSVRRVNDEYTHVKLKGPLPAECRVGDVVASTQAYPDVTIRNCVIQKNRARGLLLGSRSRILIEGNTFHTPGAAILLEGDARYWFEQAGVRDLSICNNLFQNCNFGVWGNAAIDVGAGIDPSERPRSRYNRNILIEANRFEVFDRHSVVSMYSIDGVTIRRNTITQTTAYAPRLGEKPAFDISNSSNVHIENNNDGADSQRS